MRFAKVHRVPRSDAPLLLLRRYEPQRRVTAKALLQHDYFADVHEQLLV